VWYVLNHVPGGASDLAEDAKFAIIVKHFQEKKDDEQPPDP